MNARDLAEKLRMGTCPIIPSRDAMAIGDEIMGLLDGDAAFSDLVMEQADRDRATVTAMRATLVAFGAMTQAEDDETALAMLGVLLS